MQNMKASHNCLLASRERQLIASLWLVGWLAGWLAGLAAVVYNTSEGHEEAHPNRSGIY